jgi:hypothetical protein
MNTFRLWISDDHRNVRFFDEFPCSFGILARSSSGVDPAAPISLSSGRDLAVGPHGNVGRHVLVAPEHDRGTSAAPIT